MTTHIKIYKHRSKCQKKGIKIVTFVQVFFLKVYGQAHSCMCTNLHTETQTQMQTHPYWICCWFCSKSCRVQQTALVMPMCLRVPVCAINEQQRTVCVMGNQLVQPGETLQHSNTQKRWQGPYDAAQYNIKHSLRRVARCELFSLLSVPADFSLSF